MTSSRGLVFVALVSLSCGPPPPVPEDGGGRPDAAADLCTGTDDGRACGDGRVCIGGACSASTCGDGVTDTRTEDCDDMNDVAFDGCEESCAFTCRENDACEDGNPCNGTGSCNLSTHLCEQTEPLADGTVCDAAAGTTCSRGSCSCGDGTQDTHEQCDDSNHDRLDGCDPACRVEHALRLTRFEITTTTPEACAGNTVGTALAPVLVSSINAAVRGSIEDGSHIRILYLRDLDDPLGADDAALHAGVLGGVDADGTFTGAIDETFQAVAADVDDGGLPRRALGPGSIDSRLLTASSGTYQVDIDVLGTPFAWTMLNAELTPTSADDGDALSALEGGALCGAISASQLDRTAVPESTLALCPGYSEVHSLLDLFVGGCDSLVTPAQPDTDIEADGLEEAPLADTDADGVVDSCLDASSDIAIRGDDCAQDPRFDDAYSQSWLVGFQRVQLRGVAPP